MDKDARGALAPGGGTGRALPLRDLFFLDLVQSHAPAALRPVYLLDFMRFKTKMMGKLEGTALAGDAAFAAFACHRIAAIHQFPGQVAWKVIAARVRDHAAIFLGVEGKEAVKGLDAGSLPALEAAMAGHACKEHEARERRFYTAEAESVYRYCTTCLAALGTAREPLKPRTSQVLAAVPALAYARAVGNELGMVPDDHGFMDVLAKIVDALATERERRDGMAPSKVLALLSSAFADVYLGARIPPETLATAGKVILSLRLLGNVAADWEAFSPEAILDAMCPHRSIMTGAFVDIECSKYKIKSCDRCGKILERERDVVAIAPAGKREGDVNAVLIFRATADMYKDFKVAVYQLGARTHAEIIAMLVGEARAALEAQAGNDPDLARKRRVMYEALVTSGTRISGSWGMPQTQLKVVLPERVGADFRALKATLRLKNNEAMLELLLALAGYLAREKQG
nr:hypothetical protein [Candidatus Sigynarchaeum springense]MDO8116115.1 hypothetical protein [Candidatus Sigynarchaeota archaeon]